MTPGCLSTEIPTVFEQLIEKIEAHPKYAEAMRQAVADNEELVLNYHHHGDPTTFCASICAFESGLMSWLNEGKALDEPSLRELVHVRGLGQSEEQCVPLMATLARELVEHYQLAKKPQIFLNGRGLTEGGSSGSGHSG